METHSKYDILGLIPGKQNHVKPKNIMDANYKLLGPISNYPDFVKTSLYYLVSFLKSGSGNKNENGDWRGFTLSEYFLYAETELKLRGKVLQKSMSVLLGKIYHTDVNGKEKIYDATFEPFFIFNAEDGKFYATTNIQKMCKLN